MSFVKSVTLNYYYEFLIVSLKNQQTFNERVATY